MAKNTTRCSQCRELKQIKAKGLCVACYTRSYRNKQRENAPDIDGGGEELDLDAVAQRLRAMDNPGIQITHDLDLDIREALTRSCVNNIRSIEHQLLFFVIDGLRAGGYLPELVVEPSAGMDLM